MNKSKICGECQIEFLVSIEESRAFFPVSFCPFCGDNIHEDEDDVDYALDIDEDGEFELVD